MQFVIVRTANFASIVWGGSLWTQGAPIPAVIYLRNQQFPEVNPLSHPPSSHLLEGGGGVHVPKMLPCGGGGGRAVPETLMVKGGGGVPRRDNRGAEAPLLDPPQGISKG